MRGMPGRSAILLVLTAWVMGCPTPGPCLGATSDRQPGEFRLQLKWYHQFQFAGYYAAQTKGFYAEEGLTVTILEGGPGRAPITTVLDGTADFGVSDSDVVLARLKGDPIVACAAIFQHSPYAILSRRDHNISKPSDLVGKRVMMEDEQGAAQVRAMLTLEGISPSLVDITRHSWDLADLVEGRIDAVSAYAMVEPEQLRRRGVEPAVLRTVDYGVNFYGDTLFTTSATVRRRSKEVAAFVRASLRGWDYALDHPEELVHLILQFDGVATRGLTRELLLKQAEDMRPYILPEIVPLGHMNLGRWEHIAATFASQGMAPREFTLEGFLFNPNPPVDPALVRRLLLFGAASLGIAGLVLLWNTQIRRQVRERTRELQAEVARRQMSEDGLKQALEERIRAAQALLREEEFNRALLENLDAGVVACDAQGRLTLFNRIARAWHGLGPTDTRPEEWAAKYDLYEADGTTPMAPEAVPLARALRREVVRGARMVIAPADAPHRHLVANASLVTTPDGLQLGAVTVMHDVTERQRAEAQLELQSAALNAAANAIVITDDRGRIVFSNAAFTQLTGYTAEEAVGRTPSILKSGSQSRAFYTRLWQTIEAGNSWHGELKNRRKDGTVYEEEMTVTPVRLGGGRITHYVAIKQDVTRRKLLEQQLLRSQRMESVGLLAGGIAHDLNNVLAPVLLSIGLLRTRETPAHLLEVVDIVENSARRGVDIVKQVLTFARGIEGERGPVQLRHLVRDMVRMAAETFPRNIEIRSQLATDCWTIRGDATQVHQVLLNLSVNARDAMPEGGTLTYTLQNIVVDAALAGLHPELREGQYVRVEVIDTGTGIAPEHLDRIFEPFFTTKEHGKGTGLGLATVSGILQSHGGAITVDSTPGAGSRFSVYFPAMPDLAPPRAEPGRALPRGRGELILLVDDEPSILRMAEKILRAHGYLTVSARHGVEALSVLEERNEEIAAVISDLMMPAMGGMALLAEIRRRNPRLTCIASSGLTGTSNTLRTDELKASGFQGVLTKPFTAETLLTVLDEALHR